MWLVIILIVVLYIFFCGFAVGGICSDEKLHKFKPTVWDDDMFPPLETTDDKFIFFTYWLTWPLIICFYYIPKLLFIIGKFVINYFGWLMAKIFKL